MESSDTPAQSLPSKDDGRPECTYPLCDCECIHKECEFVYLTAEVEKLEEQVSNRDAVIEQQKAEVERLRAGLLFLQRNAEAVEDAAFAEDVLRGRK
jgi:hypothetical protein